MQKPFQKLWLLLLLTLLFQPLYGENSSDFTFGDSDQENKWVPPLPVDESDRLVQFNLQAAFQHDAVLQDQAFSMLDFSAKRQLDENNVLAQGLVRFRKSLSTSDAASNIDLRLARLSYLEPWLQVTAGRFDIFQVISPNLFFGGYPIMGIHRVDGVLVTVPFSFFLNFGPAKESQSGNSSPLALSFFYTPSLFSAQEVQLDNTQTFWLSQLRFRVDSKDFSSTFRANFGGAANDYFDYSSLNGNYTGSLSADFAFQQKYDLTAEYGVQNLNLISDTGALALGFQAARLGTWGAFSLDQIVAETQFPLGNSLNNPFTGGNGFVPSLAQSPQISWYTKIRARLRVLFIELHVTNNQDDFTLARPAPGSIAVPFTGTFGPANETDGPGTPLRSASYNNLAFLVRTGVEF